MPTYSYNNVFGEDIETSEIQDGAVTAAKMGVDVIHWHLLETLTFTADATQTSGALAAYDFYLVVYDVLHSAASSIIMRVNSLNTAEYDETRFQANAIATHANKGYWSLSNGSTICNSIGRALIKGKSPAVANGQASYINLGWDVPGSINAGIYGSVDLGNDVQVTPIEVAAGAGTLTGTVRIYGGSL